MPDQLDRESLELKIARSQADEYGGIIQRNIVELSDEACDCRDCEAVIKFGIQHFDWLMAADERYRSDVYAGKQQYSKKMEDALAYLVLRWHEQCGAVLEWAARHKRLGFDVAGLEEFQTRCDESAAIISSLQQAEGSKMMSDPLILLRDKALEEHRDGQTAEFF